MFVKIKDMQRFIRQKIDFDKKKLFKKYERCKAAKIFQNKNQVKTTPKKAKFFHTYPKKQTVLKLTQTFTIKLSNHFFIQLLYEKTLLFSLTMTRPSDVQTFFTPYFLSFT